MIQSFNTFIEENDLCRKGDKILLAVSGGMDSIAMAELFFRSGYGFAIAHCNFKLRGKESEGDEAFVKAAAEGYGVECYTRSFDTAAIAEKDGVSVQMAARRLRYDFFEEVAEKHAYDHIATAHHLDDQIETFFINLTRGTGIAGLHGIQMKQEKIIRPMLFAYRNEIEQFVHDFNIIYREDESNSSTKYMRNKIRHEVLPIFREMNPAFSKEMTATMHRLAGAEQIYRQVIELAIREVVTQENGGYSLDLNKLKLFSPVSHVLYEIIVMFGFKQDDVDNILKAMDGIPGKKFLSQAYQLIIDRDKIIITGIPQQGLSFDILIDEDISNIEKPIPLSFEKIDRKGFSIPTEKQIAALDLDSLKFPLTLRKWEQGDKFIPLGMKTNKKLSDFFIDEKISIAEKERTWVLCSGNEIAWVVGHRIADPFKITSVTKKIFLINSN